MKKFGFILISIALLCVSCETEIKDIEIKHLQPIKIEIKSFYATSLAVNVTADRDYHYNADHVYGDETIEPTFDSVYLAVSTSPDMTFPTIYRAEAIKKSYASDNTITFVVTGLSSDVTYYLQAYVIPPYSKPIYSEVINHVIEIEAIDLGLSVKWANMNVGANAPEGFGDYFAWGETSPKMYYAWSTYKYCKGSSYTMTKYCTSSYYGMVDNKTVLELADDAAHQNWGGNWRLPTTAEQDELRNTDNCTWEWKTNYNGTNVNGYLVTSKKNGNTIFLPASGYRDGSSLTSVGSHGYYWCSSLYSIEYRAYCLYFYSGHVDWSSRNRYYGQSVRAVCE